MAVAKVPASFLVGLILAVLFLVPSPVRAGDVNPQPLQGGSDWSMYGASADHTFANAATPPDALGLVWSLPANGALGGASAVEENGFVYLAGFDTTGPPSGPQLLVYKIVEGNGSLFGGWSSLVNVAQRSGIPQSVARGVPRSLAVSGNLVYVLFTAGNATANREVVVALDTTTGAPAWNFTGTQTWTNATPSGTRSAPVLGSGILAFGSQDGNVYALNPSDGTLVWWIPAGAPVQTVPAIVGDYVYVAAGTHLLFLDVQGQTDSDDLPLETGGWTGDLLQDLDVGSATVASPIVVGAHVYLDAGGDLRKIDRTAAGTLWVQASPHETEGTPAFAEGLVVARRSDGRLYAYSNVTGQIEWVRSGMAAGAGAGDLAVADGRIFLSARSGTTYDLVALDATDGTILFRNTTAGRTSLGAPIVAGSKVLVTEGAALRAFRGQPDLVPDKVVMTRGTVTGNSAFANVTVTVRNLGDQPVFGVRMQVFDGDPSASGVLIGEFTIGTAASPLAPNAIATFATADRNWAVGLHDVWVVIDSALTETSTANNAQAFPIYVQPGPPPDPVVLGAGPYALALLGGFGVGILVLWFPIQRLRELRRKESEK